MSDRVYLDHAATSPLRPEARDAIERCWDAGPGNASSAHAEGRAAQAILADARARVASLAGAPPESVCFTSGGTEASNLAIRGAAHAARDRGRHVVSTRLEHSATKRACETLALEGWRITLLGADRSGRVDPHELRAAMGPDTTVVSVIAGHNELGTVQPLAALAEVAHAAGALLHLDAVQAVGTTDLSSIPWDLLSITAHKIGGPQGSGALVARTRLPIDPVLVGGSQEGGLRPGTVPVALHAGFGAAADAARAARPCERERLAQLRDRLAGLVRTACPSVQPVGAWAEAPCDALPNILTFGVRGIRSDELVLALDAAGIAASSSAACLGDARSHVLQAIGTPDDVGMVRLSLGWTTTAAEIETAGPRITATIATLLRMDAFDRRRAPFAARAAAARVALEPPHWEAAEAVFSFYQKEGVLPGARHLRRALGPSARLSDLFPDGMLSVATWLGLPVPQGGCRPGGL